MEVRTDLSRGSSRTGFRDLLYYILFLLPLLGFLRRYRASVLKFLGAFPGFFECGPPSFRIERLHPLSTFVQVVPMAHDRLCCLRIAPVNAGEFGDVVLESRDRLVSTLRGNVVGP